MSRTQKTVRREVAKAVAALEEENAELREALVIAVRHGRSGIYPVNPYIREALAVVDPEHFAAYAHQPEASRG